MSTPPKKQIDSFKEAARQLEADDDEKRFEEKLRGIVKPSPKDDKASDD